MNVGEFMTISRSDLLKKDLNKLVKRMTMIIAIIGIIFILLHLTPKLALRTHVLFTGHPYAAITSEIVDYEKREEDGELNGKVYTLTEPPIDGGLLRNWLVKKDGFLYFADYFEGEI